MIVGIVKLSKQIKKQIEEMFANYEGLKKLLKSHPTLEK